jgi:hypothetical protein
MDPKKIVVGIVIRADGTVPFDDDVPEANKAATLKHLIDEGHSVAPVEGTNHYKIAVWPKV